MLIESFGIRRVDEAATFPETPLGRHHSNTTMPLRVPRGGGSLPYPRVDHCVVMLIAPGYDLSLEDSPEDPHEQAADGPKDRTYEQ